MCHLTHFGICFYYVIYLLVMCQIFMLIIIFYQMVTVTWLHIRIFWYSFKSVLYFSPAGSSVVHEYQQSFALCFLIMFRYPALLSFSMCMPSFLCMWELKGTSMQLPGGLAGRSLPVPVLCPAKTSSLSLLRWSQLSLQLSTPTVLFHLLEVFLV